MLRPLLPFLLISVSCAPLVSHRRRSAEAPRVAEVARPKKVEPAAVAPPPPPPAQPVIIVRNDPPPPPPAVEPEPEVIEQPPAPKERTTYYAFSDVEIAKLAKRSKAFSKLRTQHKTCTAKSERLIAKREELRESIIELQNLEDRTSAEDKRLASLRNEERRMKSDKKALATCEPLEKKLTEMLQAEYGTTASLDEGVY